MHRHTCDIEVDNISISGMTTTSRDDNVTAASRGGNHMWHSTLWNVLPLTLQRQEQVQRWSVWRHHRLLREVFYLTTHSTHFIYGFMASDIWLRIILIVRKETRCRHIGYCYRLTARVLLYAPSHIQDNTYHDLCYTSCGALAGMRNSSMDPTTHRTMSERSTSESRPAPHRLLRCPCL